MDLSIYFKPIDKIETENKTVGSVTNSYYLEFPDWESLPPDEICSCVDSLTGLDYRSVRQPESLGIASLGCRLIERTCEAQTAYEQDESSDWYRERWRSWFERLENARNLSRVFDR